MTSHRTVSVGDRRAWNRLAQIVQEAVSDALAEQDKDFARDFRSRNLSPRIAAGVADRAKAEGLALTWQVKP